jgi:hypothetical protein
MSFPDAAAVMQVCEATVKDAALVETPQFNQNAKQSVTRLKTALTGRPVQYRILRPGHSRSHRLTDCATVVAPYKPDRE